MIKPGVIVVGFAIAAALAGCGSSTTNVNPGLGVLQGDVALVRSAVNAQDRSAAQVALDKLVAEVGRLRGEGQLTAARATTILSAAFEVDAALGSIPVPTTTTTSTSIPVLTTSPPPGHEPGGRNGKGKNGQ
ncbi:MAG: hypothetical protein ACYDHP_12320 [Ferrimicrobium sp.]